MSTDDTTIEAEIQAKGLNAPRLRPSDIDAVIVGETFTVLPSGKCMVCEITLRNGFTVRGESSVVSVANFDREIGEKVSRQKAKDQIWPLEAYLLQERLADVAASIRGQDRAVEAPSASQDLRSRGEPRIPPAA